MNDAGPHTEAQTPPAAADAPRLGSLLAAAREACGMSQADLARQLRLGLRQVQALEADRFTELPGPTFVRGFIRNYARAVQADQEPLLAAYERGRPRPAQPEIERASEHIAFPVGGTPKWVWYLTGVLLVVLIAPLLVYVALHDDEAPPRADKRHPAPVAVPLPAQRPTTAAVQPDSKPMPAVAPENQPNAAPVAAAQSAVPVAAPPFAPTAVATAPAPPKPEPTPASTAASVAEGKGIALQFNGDSWVEIRDASGKVVFSRLNRSGDTQLVQGKPPFSLVVGNAGQVRIAYNGKPFDLAAHTKVDVARFNLE